MAGGGAARLHSDQTAHIALSALNCHCSKHSYIRLCGQWCVVDKVNGTSTIIKLACVRSQKRTQAEQEIRELSRVCHFLLLTCCAHAEHTTNVHHSITLVLDPTSKIPILCDCAIVMTYVQGVG